MRHGHAATRQIGINLLRHIHSPSHFAITMTCINGTINPYIPSAQRPWNKQRVTHIYRRLGFGATHSQLTAALSLSPSALIDSLIDTAISMPTAAAPVWYNWTRSPIDNYTDFTAESRDHLYEWSRQWINDMIANGLRERLALFWHNHFVTEWDVYDCSAYLYEYHHLLQQYALGNFKTFTEQIGKSGAMLLYLNGAQSTKNSPNENYARELFELFTLGADNNYTETDIQQAAKALTGWRATSSSCVAPYFDSTRFDTNNKTIFGQTGAWNYDDLHNILFTQRSTEIAHHICQKLYRHFVYATPDETIVTALAGTFIANNFEIAPVLRQLFKSEHFLDDTTIGINIKSPVELLVGFLHQTEVPSDTTVIDAMRAYLTSMGQSLFTPIDVAGWAGHRTWINETQLTKRWDVLGDYLLANQTNTAYTDALVELARNLSGDSSDAAYVVQSVIDFFMPNGMYDPNAYDTATEVFKGEIPENYFTQNYWNLDWPEAGIQMINLFNHLIRLPEFQLS